jgi:ATP-dependent protease ClpP protease subunit
MIKTAVLTFTSVLTFLAGLYFIALKVPPAEARIELDAFELVDTLSDAGFETPLRDDEQLLESRKILVTTDINANVSRKLVRQLLLLNDRDNSKPIDMYLRTQGGWEADAYAVIDVMRHIGAPVNVHALGEVHSAGCMILIAATGQRIVYPRTIVGFHAWDAGHGLGPDDEVNELMTRARYISFFRSFANLPEAWLDRQDGQILNMNPRQALEYNVADVIQTDRHRHAQAPPAVSTAATDPFD